MPCNSEYMEQNGLERELQQTAKLLAFALEKLGKRVPKWVANAAAAYYCAEKRTVPLLCKTIRGMTEADLNRIVYNGRDSTSRELATWWDLHQEADKKREEAEPETAFGWHCVDFNGAIPSIGIEKDGDPVGLLKFDTVDELKRLTKTLQGAINSLERKGKWPNDG